MSELVEATIQTVKKISTELRPGILDHLGLTAAIEWQAEEFQKRTGIPCGVSIVPEEIVPDKDRSTTIFRIFQETLTNITRHAKATKVSVRLEKEDGRLILRSRTTEGHYRKAAFRFEVPGAYGDTGTSGLLGWPREHEGRP
jgi:signal transduction histidine kinase